MRHCGNAVATTGFVGADIRLRVSRQSTPPARRRRSHQRAVPRPHRHALNRGTMRIVGLGLSRGRIFWSQSMFTHAGLESRSDLLTFARSTRW